MEINLHTPEITKIIIDYLDNNYSIHIDKKNVSYRFTTDTGEWLWSEDIKVKIDTEIM